jgi:myosin heavy subunit
VFYALTSSGLLGAKRPQDYAYLNRSNCYHANNIDDYKFYQQIRASFNEIGFT